MSGSSGAAISCSGCGKRFTWQPRLAGKKGKCGCGTIVDFPSQNPADQATTEIEDDSYDVIEPPISVSPAQALPTPQPTKVLAYNRAPVKPAARLGQDEFDISDPWEGSKWKNLYLPIGLILGGTLFRFLIGILVGLVSHRPTSGAMMMGRDMGLELCVNIPLMLIGCMLAVKLFDVAFGPLASAVLKLCAIALAPDALFALLILLGALLGAAGGGSTGAIIGGGLGIVLGWALSVLLYFSLFIYFFGLTIGETWFLVIIIWVLRTFVGFFILSAIR